MNDVVSRKREKFLLLSNRRLEQTEHTLRLLGNLSANVYDWDPKEVRALFVKVRRAVDAAETRFVRSSRWS